MSGRARGRGRGGGRGAGAGGGGAGAVVRGGGPAGRSGGIAGAPLPAAHVQTIGVKRKGFGTLGQVVEVMTNHFPLDIPQEIIHHYDGLSFRPILCDYLIL